MDANVLNVEDKTALVITRIFDAPRERVWKAWTDPEEVKRWFGPKNFTTPVVKIDLREGGESLYCMRSPDGKDFWSKGKFLEIKPLERIVTTDSFADEKGNTVPASYYGMSGNWPVELQISVTFEEYEGKTRMTLRHGGFKDLPDTERTDMEHGWNESLDKLNEYLINEKTYAGIHWCENC